MSREPFDHDLSTPDRAHTYSGNTDVLQNLVDEILEPYLGGEAFDYYRYPDELKDLGERIINQEGVSEQDLLEAVLYRGKRLKNDDQRFYYDNLVSDVIEAMQLIHPQRLTVDYRIMLHEQAASRGGFHIGGGLCGPMEVTYYLPDVILTQAHLGFNAKDVDFSLFGGVDFAGTGAERCGFYLDHIPFHMAVGGSENSFYLDTDQELSLREGASNILFDDDRRYFSLVDDAGREVAECWQEFFKMKNTILVPDGEGGWRQVVPE